MTVPDKSPDVNSLSINRRLTTDDGGFACKTWLATDRLWSLASGDRPAPAGPHTTLRKPLPPLELRPLVVDQLQQHAVHRFGVDEGELAVAERTRTADER